MVQNYKKLNSTILSKLRSIVEKDNCFDDFETRWSYAFGGINFQKEWIPDLILIPKTDNHHLILSVFMCWIILKSILFNISSIPTKFCKGSSRLLTIQFHND